MLSRQTIVSAALAAVLLAVPVHAAPVIEFSTGSAGEGGTISWDGTNLKGAYIPIGAVTISGAPANNGTYLVTEGRLFFDTGSHDGVADYHHTSLGHLRIVGCVPELGLDPYPYGGSCGTLMLGLIQGWDDTLAAQGLLDVFGAAFTGGGFATGLPPELSEPAWSFRGLSVVTSMLNADGTPGTVSHTSLRNTNVVPEPGTMILLGTGLLAALRARRPPKS